MTGFVLQGHIYVFMCLFIYPHYWNVNLKSQGHFM